MCQRFTSAGGDEKWEDFVLPETVIISQVIVVAVEGTDQEDQPALRVTDCQVLGEHISAGSQTVSGSLCVCPAICVCFKTRIVLRHNFHTSNVVLGENAAAKGRASSPDTVFFLEVDRPRFVFEVLNSSNCTRFLNTCCGLTRSRRLQ